MAKAALLVLIAAAAGLLVYLLAAPHFVHDSPVLPSASTQQGGMQSPTEQNPVRSGAAAPAGDSVENAPGIAIPKTSEQISHETLEKQRGPLYAWIRENMQMYLVGWQPSSADPATLDLYMARSNFSDISQCMSQLVTPYASKYGFNHVRFFVPNSPSSIDRWRVDSEASPDDAGAWHAYRK